MTIKITLNELVNSNQALMEMGELTTMPAKTAFAIGIVIRRTRDEMRGWNDQRKRILNSLFPPPAADSKEPVKLMPHPQVPGELWLNPGAITREESEKVNAALDELGTAEIEIETSKLKLAAFGDKVALKPSWLASLHWLIDE